MAEKKKGIIRKTQKVTKGRDFALPLEALKEGNIMKRLLLSLCFATTICFSTSVHANVTLNFVKGPFATNSAVDVAIVEAQIFVVVSGDVPGEILFEFHNDGPDAATVANIYFRDGIVIDPTSAAILDIDSGDDANVNFESGSSPGNPPGWTGSLASFFKTSAKNPKPTWGINNGDLTGDTLGITFDLLAGKTLTDVETALANHDLEIAMHVIAFADDGSEWMINNGTITIAPAPGALLLGSMGMGFVGWLKRRRSI